MFFILLYRHAGARYHPPPRESSPSNPKFKIAQGSQSAARSRDRKEKMKVEQSYHLERRSIL
ncbi:hypothetical protein IQ249_00475 [Lusitaniella coriacea LEGE 07157]|uniref:Uncharacterized protein n=1 Tax=Lusitaniella coriacea LEGE 07157 TaxID=945747 RepID=A0A8J7B2H3_9CYAN|nr:hypothetical protein [Lusitaniella coriacea]MBE9114362.1 hypothetical protein [Lusitaniella coriacea LEGE 07157]